jgi:hypothetical protein
VAIPAFRLPPAGRIALALTLLLVAACSGPQKPPARTSAAAAPPAATASGRDTSPRPAAVPDAKPSDGNKIAALVPPPPPPPLPNLSAGQFIGRGPDDLVELLGEPRLIRRDYPAEIWQYVRPGCVLLVFLYESTVEPQRVWYLEMHDGSVALASLSTVAQRTCLQGFYRDSREITATSES